MDDLPDPAKHRIKYRCHKCKKVLTHPTAFMLNQLTNGEWKCGNCGAEFFISIHVRLIKRIRTKKVKVKKKQRSNRK